VLVDTTFHRLVESTEEPFPTVIIVVLVVIEEPVICRRLFVFADRHTTRLSIQAVGMYWSVKSHDTLPCEDTVLATLYVR